MFSFTADSKFNRPFPVQQAAISAVDEARRSGVVVAPCGAGKTMLILKYALRHDRTLVLCYESQGVLQVRDAFLSETTVRPEFVQVHTHDHKATDLSADFCILITSLAMFAGVQDKRSEATKTVGSFVRSCAWDAIIIDEVHHAAAETYRALVVSLIKKNTFVLGLTATLTRELGSQQLERIKAGASREEAMQDTFRFLAPHSSGPVVLFEQRMADLQQAGAIAKVTIARVDLAMSKSCRIAHEVAEGYTKRYLASAHVEKLKLVWAITRMHQARGDIGVVFVDHLFPAHQLIRMLGSRWRLLSGSTAVGAAETHTLEGNRKIIADFNAKKIDGVVGTSVVESSVNFKHESFCYAILVDGHGGEASSLQKVGRLSRTGKKQKKAIMYELVTLDTEEVTAATQRREAYGRAGYSIRDVEPKKLMTAAESLGVDDFPYAAPLAKLRLLVEALTYTDHATALKQGKEAARLMKQPHQKQIKNVAEKKNSATNPLFKKRHADVEKSLRKKSKHVNAAAAQLCGHQALGSVAPAVLVEVMRRLETPEAYLRQLGVDLRP